MKATHLGGLGIQGTEPHQAIACLFEQFEELRGLVVPAHGTAGAAEVAGSQGATALEVHGYTPGPASAARAAVARLEEAPEICGAERRIDKT